MPYCSGLSSPSEVNLGRVVVVPAVSLELTSHRYASAQSILFLSKATCFD